MRTSLITTPLSESNQLHLDLARLAEAIQKLESVKAVDSKQGWRQTSLRSAEITALLEEIRKLKALADARLQAAKTAFTKLSAELKNPTDPVHHPVTPDQVTLAAVELKKWEAAAQFATLCVQAFEQPAANRHSFLGQRSPLLHPSHVPTASAFNAKFSVDIAKQPNTFDDQAALQKAIGAGAHVRYYDRFSGEKPIHEEGAAAPAAPSYDVLVHRDHSGAVNFQLLALTPLADAVSVLKVELEAALKTCIPQTPPNPAAPKANRAGVEKALQSLKVLFDSVNDTKNAKCVLEMRQQWKAGALPAVLLSALPQLVVQPAATAVVPISLSAALEFLRDPEARDEALAMSDVGARLEARKIMPDLDQLPNLEARLKAVADLRVDIATASKPVTPARAIQDVLAAQKKILLTAMEQFCSAPQSPLIDLAKARGLIASAAEHYFIQRRLLQPVEPDAGLWVDLSRSFGKELTKQSKFTRSWVVDEAIAAHIPHIRRPIKGTIDQHVGYLRALFETPRFSAEHPQEEVQDLQLRLLLIDSLPDDSAAYPASKKALEDAYAVAQQTAVLRAAFPEPAVGEPVVAIDGARAALKDKKRELSEAKKVPQAPEKLFHQKKEEQRLALRDMVNEYNVLPGVKRVPSIQLTTDAALVLPALQETLASVRSALQDSRELLAGFPSEDELTSGIARANAESAQLTEQKNRNTETIPRLETALIERREEEQGARVALRDPAFNRYLTTQQTAWHGEGGWSWRMRYSGRELALYDRCLDLVMDDLKTSAPVSVEKLREIAARAFQYEITGDREDDFYDKAQAVKGWIDDKIEVMATEWTRLDAISTSDTYASMPGADAAVVRKINVACQRQISLQEELEALRAENPELEQSIARAGVRSTQLDGLITQRRALEDKITNLAAAENILTPIDASTVLAQQISALDAQREAARQAEEVAITAADVALSDAETRYRSALKFEIKKEFRQACDSLSAALPSMAAIGKIDEATACLNALKTLSETIVSTHSIPDREALLVVVQKEAEKIRKLVAIPSPASEVTSDVFSKLPGQLERAFVEPVRAIDRAVGEATYAEQSESMTVDVKALATQEGIKDLFLAWETEQKRMVEQTDALAKTGKDPLFDEAGIVLFKALLTLAYERNPPVTQEARDRLVLSVQQAVMQLVLKEADSEKSEVHAVLSVLTDESSYGEAVSKVADTFLNPVAADGAALSIIKVPADASDAHKVAKAFVEQFSARCGPDSVASAGASPVSGKPRSSSSASATSSVSASSAGTPSGSLVFVFSVGKPAHNSAETHAVDSALQSLLPPGGTLVQSHFDRRLGEMVSDPVAFAQLIEKLRAARAITQESPLFKTTLSLEKAVGSIKTMQEAQLMGELLAILRLLEKTAPTGDLTISDEQLISPTPSLPKRLEAIQRQSYDWMTRKLALEYFELNPVLMVETKPRVASDVTITAGDTSVRVTVEKDRVVIPNVAKLAKTAIANMSQSGVSAEQQRHFADTAAEEIAKQYVATILHALRNCYDNNQDVEALRVVMPETTNEHELDIYRKAAALVHYAVLYAKQDKDLSPEVKRDLDLLEFVGLKFKDKAEEDAHIRRSLDPEKSEEDKRMQSKVLTLAKDVALFEVAPPKDPQADPTTNPNGKSTIVSGSGLSEVTRASTAYGVFRRSQSQATKIADRKRVDTDTTLRDTLIPPPGAGA